MAQPTSRSAIAATAAAAFFAAPAAAEEANTGLYIEGRTSATYLMDTELDGPELKAAGLDDVMASSYPGFGIDGAFGYALGSGMRGEIDLGYRRNEVKQIDAKFLGTPFTDEAGGEVTVLTVFANGYYDFRLGGDTDFTPFVGVGFGLAFMGNEDDFSDDNELRFGYQASLGTAYRFTDSLSATVAYSFLSVFDPSFDRTEFEYLNHNLTVGLRFWLP